jgi:hypothetical protein
MDFEIEPAYAKPIKKNDEPRTLVFENEGREVVKKEFAQYGLEAVSAWTDDSFGRVVLKQGDLIFQVRPGFNVFVAVKAA